MSRRWETITDLDVGGRAWPFHREMYFPVLKGLRTRQPRGVVSGRNGFKQFPNTHKHSLRIKIPRDCHNSIIRNIECTIMSVQILACDRVQVSHITNDL